MCAREAHGQRQPPGGEVSHPAATWGAGWGLREDGQSALPGEGPTHIQ